MDRSVTISVFGSPAPQPRPRVTRTGHCFNPPSADAWKAAVRAAWMESGQAPFTRHVSLSLHFYLGRPASHLKKRGGLRSSAPKLPTGRPDLDNLIKAVQDALGDAGAFPNDAAIIAIHSTKTYGDCPGCHASLTERDI